jgi:hypothetical protein
VVTITALISIAERVGATRIFKTEGRFHHPMGDPTLPLEAERAWRLNLLRAAIKMLMVPVEKPTVGTVHDLAAR